ncbi:MAG: response regulator [Chloroflexaceae bacterium]|nr:response regulator [Chloroflexaceae bacterium]
MNAASPDILLIEDSPTQALQFQLMLQRAGYKVDVIADGSDAWKRAYETPPDLILLDINLPTLNGLQVLLRLKCGKSTRKIPVIMLSRFDDVRTVEQALELGADDYIFKDDCRISYGSHNRLCEAVDHFLHAIVATPA